MKSLFKSAEAKQKLLTWYDRFRERVTTAPTESKTVTTKFGDTHVLIGGPENGPPVVLLHGALATSAHMMRELQPMMRRFRVYAVDVIGQSVKSADTRLKVNNNDYGVWLSEVLDGLGLKKVHLVGISWGGFVSIRFAALAPDRIDRLVLMVPAGVVKGKVWEGFARVGWPMMRYVMSPTAQRLHNFTRNLLTTDGDEEWRSYMGDAFLSYNLGMNIPALAKPDELKALKAPTLVIAADDDVSFPGDRLLARAPELFPALAEKELIKDCRHCPPTTDEFREWLSNRISTFLMPI